MRLSKVMVFLWPATLASALLALSLEVAHTDGGRPGKLSKAHAELDGERTCRSCHVHGDRVEAKLCLDCHTVLAKRVRARKGFHAGVAKVRCESCHTEHKGRVTEIIKWPGKGMNDFNHRRTGHRLEGAHKNVKCRSCHKPAFQADAAVKKWPTGRRQRTFLGLEEACISCHTDVHSGKHGTDCRSCHNPNSWRPTAPKQ